MRAFSLLFERLRSHYRGPIHPKVKPNYAKARDRILPEAYFQKKPVVHQHPMLPVPLETSKVRVQQHLYNKKMDSCILGPVLPPRYRPSKLAAIPRKKSKQPKPMLSHRQVVERVSDFGNRTLQVRQPVIFKAELWSKELEKFIPIRTCRSALTEIEQRSGGLDEYILKQTNAESMLAARIRQAILEARLKTQTSRTDWDEAYKGHQERIGTIDL